MRDERGQGTVDYVAILLVVAAVMAAAVALLAGTGLGDRVMDAFRRALCVVTGGDCAADGETAAEPCVRSSEEHRDGGHLTFAAIRIGHDDVALRERLGDGTVRVTLVEGASAGLELGVGAAGHLRWGTRTYAAGAELRAAVLAGQASGRTWVVADDAAAERLVEQVALAARSQRPVHTVADSPDLVPMPAEVHAPEPDATFSERTSELGLDLQRRGRFAATLSKDEAYGERVERATGRRTVYVRDASGARGKVAFGRGFSARGEAESSERYAITYDADGRPVDLAVLSVLDVDGTAGLPPGLSRIAGWLDIDRDTAGHVETEQHLDLTETANAEVAERFLAGGSALGVRLAAKALGERLDDAGTLSVRSYATHDEAHEVGGHLKAVGGFGGEVGSEDASARLTAAVRRGSGGAWEHDPACAVLA